nr:reverse transcriptase domain-containing protein [Tanacetum cinerariifolium]
MNEGCLAFLLNKLPSKEKDPGSFTIPCQVSDLHIDNALPDLGSSISLMPYMMYEKLGLGEPKPTRMSLELADRILIILGRPFIATVRAMIDVFNKKITLKVGDDEVIFDMDQSMKKPPFEDDECYGFDDLDGTHTIKNKHLYSASANEIDEKKPDLKDLPSLLEYTYLHGNQSFPIIISSYSPWVSPIHVVPNKGGMTVVLNDNNKVIPSRIVTGRRVCIDYHTLNDANQKDHFPIPFIDQMLERLSGNEYYCFLDGFSGFFHIPISLEDQVKMTFTCPHGTFAYRRMSFGLCNALVTFQRCMTVIFHDMVEDFMEVFMVDFSIFDNSFNCYLANLDKMLARCEETNLVLNWEKCHYMVKEGIVLGHKIYGSGIEVDKAKIDVIAKLPYQTNVKGAENLVVDYLSRLENPHMEVLNDKEIVDEFSDEHLMMLKTKFTDNEPWPTGGHHIASVTERKVYESGFYWPSILRILKNTGLKLKHFLQMKLLGLKRLHDDIRVTVAQVQDYALWDVIESGKSFKPVAQTITNDADTLTTLILGSITTVEKAQKKNDVKERSMLLMALLNDHLMTFNQYKDAKSLFVAIQIRFGGNEARKKTQKTLLKQMYENFSALSTDRTNEVNNAYGVSTANPQANPARTQVNTASTQDLNVEETPPKVMVAIDGVGFDWSYMAEDEVPTNMALIAFLDSEFNKSEFNLATYKRGLASVEEQLVFYKKNKVLFSEQIAILKRDISYKDSKISVLKREYNAVPHPPTRLFSPLKLDLSNSGLEEFQQLEFEGYRSKTSKSVCDDISNEVKENPNAPLVKDSVSDNKDCSVESHVVINCNYHQMERVVSRNNYTRVNYNNSTRKTRPNAHKNMAPRAVLMKTGLRPLITAHPTVYCAKPMSHFSKSAQSTLKRPYQQRTPLTNKSFSQTVNTTRPRLVNTSRPRPINTARPRPVNTARRRPVNTTRPNLAVVNAVRVKQSHPQKEDQGCVDSGCSRHMVGNMSYLSDFKEFDGGYVTFRGGANGGKNTEIENLVDKKVKVIRCDNGIEFKNSVMNDFYAMKGIKRKFSVARTPQQNGVAERRNKTLIEAARTILANFKLPTTFWAKPITTVCYVQNRNASNDEPQPFSDSKHKDVVGVSEESKINNQEKFENNTQDVNTDGPSINNASTNCGVLTRRMTKTTKDQGFISAVYEGKTHEDLHTCLFACFLSQEEPKKVWTLVDLPYGKRVIGTKWVFRNKKDDRGIVIKNKARLVAQVYQMDMNNAFLYGRIEDEVYVCQSPAFEDPDHPDKDKYADEILKKFGFSTVKTACTPMETSKPLLKHAEAEDVDVNLYRSMIGSLIYLTALRPDIMFVVCACVIFQVTPKVSHLYAVKRIFGYLKGQPKLGLWYPKDSPFDLEAYTDSDYDDASLDKKSIIGVAIDKILDSKLNAGLWIQFHEYQDFFIDNESAIYIVKNSVFHSKTKHIEIRHHFIRDSNKKKLIQMIKIQIDQNVLDLLTKAFDVKTINGEEQIQALMDKKKVRITETSVRSDLHLEVAKVLRLLLGMNLVELWPLLSSVLPQTKNSSKYIFDHMVKNLEYGVNFLMFPRFVQVFLDSQVEGMLKHKEIYVTPSHTKKIFANMKRHGNNFSSKKHKMSKKRITEVPQLSDSTHDVADEHVTTTSNDPLLSDNQALEIRSLKRRVKRLEKKASKKSYKLKRLYKIGSSTRVESSEDAGLGDQENASKQRRMIDDLDTDHIVALIDETQGRKDHDMFDTSILDDEEVVAEKEVNNAHPVSTAGEVVTTAGVEEEESNIALIESCDNTQAMMDANYELALRLQEEERGELTIEEKSRLFVELMDKRMKYFARLKAKKIKKAFVPMDIELVKGSEKAVKGSKKAIEGSEKAAEGSFKKAGDKLEQEDAKRQMIKKENESAKLKRCLEIILDDDDDVTIEATHIF